MYSNINMMRQRKMNEKKFKITCLRSGVDTSKFYFVSHHIPRPKTSPKTRWVRKSPTCHDFIDGETKTVETCTGYEKMSRSVLRLTTCDSKPTGVRIGEIVVTSKAVIRRYVRLSRLCVTQLEDELGIVSDNQRTSKIANIPIH